MDATTRTKNGKTLYLRPDGLGYESAKAQRERWAREAAKEAAAATTTDTED